MVSNFSGEIRSSEDFHVSESVQLYSRVFEFHMNVTNLTEKGLVFRYSFKP